jgi:hypothetical protein
MGVVKVAEKQEIGRALREPALVSDQAPSGLDPSGFDPARVEVLSLGYTKALVECSKERWWEIFRSYSAKARSHAANLAAHNWDVLLIGGRVFLHQPKYGGPVGHWLSPDGTREDVTEGQMKALYAPWSPETITRLFVEADAPK